MPSNGLSELLVN